MTVVIGYVTKTITIILADRRINYGKNQEFGYSDDKTKLVELPNMGWASGAGLAGFLDSFKDSLKGFDGGDVNELSKVFQHSLDAAMLEAPEFAEYIDSSVAMASWVGASTDLQDWFFRIGIFSNKHFGEGIALVSDENIHILYPGEYIDNPQMARDLEEKINLNYKFDGDVNAVLSRMFEIFEEIIGNTKYVSSLCDVGIHALTQEGIYKIKLSGEINDLVSEQVNGTLQDRFEVVKFDGIKAT